MKSCVRIFKKFYEECEGQKHNEEKIAYRELNKSDEFRFDSNLYESNIHPILRFIHKVQKVKNGKEKTLYCQPSGWIEFDYDNTNVVSTPKYRTSNQFDNIPFNFIKPYECDSISNYLIASFDIECDSSHGDFPAPRKYFKRICTHIVDKLIQNNDSINKVYFDIKKELKENIRKDIEKGDNNFVYIKYGTTFSEESLLKEFIQDTNRNDTIINSIDGIPSNYVSILYY